MKIDFSTLAFGYHLRAKGGTPNWATSLGQSHKNGYRINNTLEIDELLKGLIYTSIPLSKVSTKIGKGGKVVRGNEDESSIIMASMFLKVYINETLIKGGCFLILLTKDTSATHTGRLRIKYGPSNTYHGNNDYVYNNEKFWKMAKNQLGLDEKSCFFVHSFTIENQDTIILNTIVINRNNSVEYADTKDQHLHWDPLIEEDRERIGKSRKIVHKVDCERKEDEDIKNCFDVTRTPRTDKMYPLNLIIYGAPGTGKTYSTVEYAQAIIEGISIQEFREKNRDRKEVVRRYNELIEKGQIVFTTFHQNYGYEEFIQGLRPDINSDNMKFNVIDGIFKRIADKALVDNENKYVIIVDEINRANISKVFGELITLIEEDKRWGELNQISVTLQSGEVFAIPNNLYIIGTMNSADKSISLIDAALRRRFEFMEQKPDASLVKDQDMRNVLKKINMSLVEQLDSSDLLIGHSYFMNKTISDLPKVINNSIIPLLYEYFYDNKKKVKGVLNSALDQVDYIVEDDNLGRIFIERQKNN